MPRDVNYTSEETKMMVEEYKGDPNMTTVRYLASTLNKSTKSIVGKLAREGVYKKEVYVSKTGGTPETKPEIITKIRDRIIEMVGSCPPLLGIEKSSKNALKDLEEVFRKL